MLSLVYSWHCIRVLQNTLKGRSISRFPDCVYTLHSMDSGISNVTVIYTYCTVLLLASLMVSVRMFIATLYSDMIYVNFQVYVSRTKPSGVCWMPLPNRCGCECDRCADPCSDHTHNHTCLARASKHTLAPEARLSLTLHYVQNNRPVQTPRTAFGQLAINAVDWSPCSSTVTGI